MKISSSDCDANKIEAFLTGKLHNEDEALFAEHLNNCPACCERLEQHAVWQEAETHLKRTRFDGQSFDEAFATEEETLAARKPLQIQNVIDTLAPSEDPRMLGRLGNYEVSGIVGAGAMGVVLKANDPSLDRAVAIKVLSPHLASSGAARKRFAREAKAAAAVLHSNVIAIHSVSNEHSLPYLVMPYVRSTSLQKRIDQSGALPTNEVLRIAAQVAAGLAAAHAQGLVHRDIKPANILLEEGVERVAITDFGLARAVDDASLTRTGFIAGTPQYMSPEQSRGDSIGLRSDLFSLGSVMYAMCVGRPPFRAETTYGVIQRINNDHPRPILELNPDVPAWLAGIIAKLMSKKVDDRFESAEEVSELLESCLAHVQHPSAVPLPSSIAVQPKSRGRFLGGSRRLIYMLGAAGAVLVALAIMFFMSDLTWLRSTDGRTSSDAGFQTKLHNRVAKAAADESSIPDTEALPDLTDVGTLDVDPTNPERLIMHYCHADGRPIRPLLKDPELRRLLDRQGSPDVSADGQRVAFDAWSTFDKTWENGRIVVCDIDGDNAHVITDGYMPTFSPDGKRLVFSRLPKYTKADGVSGKSIWICNVDGSGKEVVLQHGAWGARWSRDGKSLVFYNYDVNDRRTHPPNCVRLYDFATKKTTNVFEPQDSPFNRLMYHYEWATGEQRTVIFAGRLKDGNNMVSATIDVDAGLKSLKTFDLNRSTHGVGYDWHPNGNDILVDGDGHEALLLMSAETGEVSNPFVNFPANVSVRDATFTPDGEHLIASFSAMPDRKNRHNFRQPAKAVQLKQQPDGSVREIAKAKFEKATHWNADPNANIFPDGMLDRHEENNIPVGWQDKSAFETSHARIVGRERGVVQMECPKDGSESTFGTTLALPKGTQYVTILTRMRGSSIQLGHSENTGAGMIYSLIGENGKKRSTPRLEPIYKYGSLGGWKTYRRTIKVRPGETKLGISASMVDVIGYFEVDRVQVVPSQPGYEATPGEVKTMRTAIREDDDETIGLIIDSAPELLEYRDGTFENSTPLIYATVQDSPKAVKKLIELGANMEAVDESWENTPLAWCCWWGNYEAAEVLVKAGAKLKDFDNKALNSKKKNEHPLGQLEDFDRIAQLIREAKEKAKSSK